MRATRPPGWISLRHRLPYCFKCPLLSEADVTAPRCKREWLPRRTILQCSSVGAGDGSGKRARKLPVLCGSGILSRRAPISFQTLPRQTASEPGSIALPGHAARSGYRRRMPWLRHYKVRPGHSSTPPALRLSVELCTCKDRLAYGKGDGNGSALKPDAPSHQQQTDVGPALERRVTPSCRSRQATRRAPVWCGYTPKQAKHQIDALQS